MFEEIRTLFAIDKNDGFTEKEVSLACDAYSGLPEVLRQYYFQLECDCLSDFLCAMANFQAASWGLPSCSERFSIWSRNSFRR